VQHLKKHGDVEKSLAAIPAGSATRESLVQLGDPDLCALIVQLAPGSALAEAEDPDRTASFAVGTATSDGQRFRVLRPHARGGLGAVFVALDTELHREVALKQILDRHADDPGSRTRFLLEAEVTGRLEHPGIVPVYSLGTYTNGRPYYAMRFIRGDSLKDAVEQFHTDKSSRHDAGRRSLEFRKLLQRFVDVCNAIQYAHSRGVLHRDIKPSNVIVGRHGETPFSGLGFGQCHWPVGPDGRRADTSAFVVRRRFGDVAGLGAGHASVHESGAGQGRSRSTWSNERCVQPRCHAVLPPDRQAAVRGV
jgi:hypothetical protein